MCIRDRDQPVRHVQIGSIVIDVLQNDNQLHIVLDSSRSAAFVLGKDVHGPARKSIGEIAIQSLDNANITGAGINPIE